jgi:hypothetical protein
MLRHNAHALAQLMWHSMRVHLRILYKRTGNTGYYMVWCRGYHQLTCHHAPCSDKCTQSQSWEDKTYRDVEITLTGWYKKWSLQRLTKNWRECHLNPMQLTVQKLKFFGKSWTLWIDCTHLENLTKSGRRSGTVLNIYKEYHALVDHDCIVWFSQDTTSILHKISITGVDVIPTDV